MKALITGGAGFIGSNLALFLEKLNWNVKVLDDFSGGSAANLKGFQQEIVNGDLFSLKSRLGGWFPEIIFHQSGITDTTIQDIQRMTHVNVEGFRKVLDFANHKDARVVYASSAAVYGNGPLPMQESQQRMPLNAYAGTKVEMETLAKEYAESGGSVIGLRYFNVYGPNEHHKSHMASMIWQLALQMAAGRKPRIFQWGEQERDQIYVEDVVRANLLAAKSDANGVLNIGTGKSVSFNQITYQLCKTLDCTASTEYFENPYGSYQSRTLADTKMAERVLDFSAEYDLASGIEEYFRQVHPHKYVDVVAANTR